MSQRGLYAIIDALTSEIVGGALGIIIHKHEAAAIRGFGDAAAQQGSIISTHPRDHALVRLGYLQDGTNELLPDYQVVITGEQWLAAQINQENRGA